MGNRKKATEELLKLIGKVLPGKENVEIYEARLAKMNNAQFDEYMQKLASGEEILSLTVPNFSKNKLNAAKNVALAKSLGHNMFQRLTLTDPESGVTYQTPIEYLVVDMPVRRQAQLLSKKISIPKDNSRVDELTGQSAADRVGGISFPEIQTLNAQGLESTIMELVKYRGGDEEGFRAMNNALLKTGSVDLSTIPTGTRAKSTDTLSTFLKAMHLENTL